MKKSDFLAPYLRQKRIDIGLTQRELARALFVSDKTISKWERGESLPSLAQIGDILEVLHIDFTEFSFMLRPTLDEDESNGSMPLNHQITLNLIKHMEQSTITGPFQLNQLLLPEWNKLSALQRRQIERYLAQMIQTGKINWLEVAVTNDPPPYKYTKKVYISIK